MSKIWAIETDRSGRTDDRDEPTAVAVAKFEFVTDLGRQWTRGTVHQVLINEKYIGNNVWNRGSFKLKKKRIRNSHMWIRADGVFEPLIDRALFEAARAIITDRSKKLTNEEMLAALHRLLER